MIEQCIADFIEIREMAGYDEHRPFQCILQPVYVDDIESGESDSLKQNGLKMGIKARTRNQLSQYPSRVRTVPAHFSREDAVKTSARVEGAYDHDIAPMMPVERRIIEPDRMRKTRRCH